MSDHSNEEDVEYDPQLGFLHRVKRIPVGDWRDRIRDEIMDYECKGMGAGQTPREYAEALADRVAAAILRPSEERR